MNKKLADIITTVLRLKPKEVSENLSMDTCATWDSLCHMELIAEIERVFNIQLSFESIIKMRSVKGIIDVLNKKYGDQ